MSREQTCCSGWNRIGVKKSCFSAGQVSQQLFSEMHAKPGVLLSRVTRPQLWVDLASKYCALLYLATKLF